MIWALILLCALQLAALAGAVWALKRYVLDPEEARIERIINGGMR